MTGAGRKRLWRARHPERSAEAERERAKLRRVEARAWQRWACEPGRTIKEQGRAAMISSYRRYEGPLGNRYLSRLSRRIASKRAMLHAMDRLLREEPGISAKELLARAQAAGARR